MGNENALSKKGKKSYGIIYKATNTVNGKVYIGQTVKRLTVRKNAHLNSIKDSNLKDIYFYKALNKYGKNAFKWEVIDHAADKHELSEKEIYWISYYNSHGEGGYNLTDGGEGAKGYRVTEEGIERRKKVFEEMWANGHSKTLKIGEDSGMAKLTNEDVFKIRDLLIQGNIKTSDIAEIFKCSYTNIHAIKTGKIWRHIITEEDVNKMNKPVTKGIKSLNDSDILEIKALLIETDIPSEEAYEMFNIDYKSWWSILKSKKWSHLFTKNEILKIKNRKNKKELSQKEIVEIKFLLSQKDLKQVEIAKMFNVRPNYIGKIARGERRSDIVVPENYKSYHK